MTTLIASVTFHDQSSYYNTDCQCNKSENVILNSFQEPCGYSAVSYCQVTIWVNEFKNDRVCVKDTHRADRSVTDYDNYHTERN